MSAEPASAPGPDYRIVVTREGEWWVATAHGTGMPNEGMTARSRTIAELDDMICHSILEQRAALRGYTSITSYDLPMNGTAGIDGFRESCGTLRQATHDHADRARRIASGLASEHQASVHDVAAIMDVSYLRAAQLLAEHPRPTVVFQVRGPGHYWKHDVPRWVAFAAAQQARTLRVIASDRLRAALEGYLEQPRH